MEAEGLTGPSRENVSAALDAATADCRPLLDQLQAEFPIGTDPVRDTAAQEAVQRILTRLRGESTQG